MNARAVSLMVMVKRLGNLHGEDFFATRDAIQAGIESLEEDLIEAEKVVHYAGECAAALQGMLDRYVGLVNSGDAGNWNPETEPEVIAARAALSKPSSPRIDFTDPKVIEHVKKSAQAVPGVRNSDRDARVHRFMQIAEELEALGMPKRLRGTILGALDEAHAYRAPVLAVAGTLYKPTLCCYCERQILFSGGEQAHGDGTGKSWHFPWCPPLAPGESAVHSQ